MSLVLRRIVSLLIGYAFGLFQTGYLYGKLKGVDIRKSGSGNSGTTNALRTLGKKAGLIVLAGDMIKSLLACFICAWLFGDSSALRGGNNILFMLYAGVGCSLGHNFPFFMQFHGGKGVAVMGGIIISISPTLVFIGLPIFLGAVILTRYVSLGSLLVAAELLIGWPLVCVFDGTALYRHLRPESCILTALISVLVVWMHRENIKRLLAGNERKIFEKKSGPGAGQK